MSLLDSLKERFKVEQTEYGNCVVIPKREWTTLPANWEAQLEKEGAKVFTQSWNGEAAFFVKMAEATKQRKLRLRRWTEEDIAKLKQLHSENLTIGTIAKELGRSYFGVQHMIERLQLPRDVRRREAAPDPTPKGNDDVVKEFLSACSLLYPSHRQACAYLLREASKQILAEAKE